MKFTLNKMESFSFKSAVLLSCVLFAVILAEEEKKKHSEFPSVSKLPKSFYRLKKREEEEAYLEQCRFVNPWNRQLGYVNVFAFLNLSWTYSYRQAIMLRLLKKRLEKAGFSDIWFFVVIAPPNYPEDKTENEKEIKTWRKIYTFDTQDILNSAEVTLNDIEADIESDTIFIQDTAELGIWESFRASKNQIVIIDRCGKLTYQIIVPWSILYFPYVKAAILSTYKEDPCGPCSVPPIIRPLDYEEYLFGNVSMKETNDVQKNTDYETEEQNSTNNNTKDEDGSNTGMDLESDRHLSTLPPEIEETTVNDYTAPINVAITTERSAILKTNMSEDTNATWINNMNSTKNEEVEAEESKEEVQFPTTTEENTNVVDENNILPIRIIMRAPHLHEENKRHRKYSTMILKIGDPNYHEHHDSGQDIPQIVSHNGELHGEGEPVYNYHDPALLEYIYNRDESPGLYGEVADHWKSYDDDEYINKTQAAEFLPDYEETTGPNEDVIETAEYNQSNSGFESNIDTGNKATQDETDSQETEHDIIRLDESKTNENDASASNKDEDAKQKLINHYRKLLPWVYYVL